MSTTRRVFLQRATLGVVALAILNTHGAHASAGRLQFDRVFFDPRGLHGLNFGEAARRMGARTQSISGDMGDPCFEYLRRRWRTARAPVAGITDFRVLSLVQMMASDAGLRPVLRIHHCGHGMSRLHEAFGSSAYRAASHSHLSRAGVHWSGAAARLVLSLDVRDTDDGSDSSAACLGAVDSRALVTWAMV